MKALLLEDAGKLAVRDLPEPVYSDDEVLIQVGAVGVCGTDFHIYGGFANYNLDEGGRPIPLTVQPQILGHEFCGKVQEVGRKVRGVRPGDRVAVDQGLNCYSRNIHPSCEYCRSGHSHQCLHYAERGITGIPGAMQERVTMPAVNTVPIDAELSFDEAALIEPLGCVLHAVDMTRQADARYTLPGTPGGSRPIQNVLILGAGPAGLLFLQVLRKVAGFEGTVLVADRIREKLERVRNFDGIPLHTEEVNLVEAVRELTGGQKVDLLIEAAGSGSAFEMMPPLLRKQATVVLYGHGHEGTDMSVLNHLLYLEPALIAPVGASGGFDPESHRPLTHGRSAQLISNGTVQVRSLITHRYRALEEVERAFAEDSRKPDYVKGVLVMA